MKRIGLIAFVFLTALAASPDAWATTFLIDTWEDAVPEKMDLETRKRVVSAETGIMDTLFNTGHIFFNTYSVPGENNTQPDFAQSMDLAVEIGAEFLLRLDPAEEGLGWTLFDTSDETVLGEGFEAIDEVDPDLPTVERWTSLGLLVAGEMMSSIGN